MLELNTIVSALLQDHAQGRPIDAALPTGRPTLAAGAELLELLRTLLFPGYYGDARYCRQESYISMLAAQAHFRLETLLSPQTGPEAARQISLGLLHDIPRLRGILQQDLDAFLAGDPAATGEAEIITAYPGFQAIMAHRLANTLLNLGATALPRLLSEVAHSRTGIDIHPGATIGPAFFIDHGTGVVIGETAAIGRGVKIYQGVTLGALSTRGGQGLKGKKRHPTIEDGVTIYANASILGGDTVIGQGATIGGNAFVTASVPAGATVTGNRPGP